MFFLGTKHEIEETDFYINEYLKENFEIKINESQEPCSFTFIGKEVEKEVIWCYVEILDVKKIKHIIVINKILPSKEIDVCISTSYSPDIGKE